MHNHFDKNLNVKDLIEQNKPEIIIELGAAWGENTIQLVTMAKVITITDNSISGPNAKALKAAISKGDLEWIQAISFEKLKEYPRDSMSFVSIDTDHNYMTLKLELDELYRTVRDDGIVVMHDVEMCRGENRLQKSLKRSKKYGSGEAYDMELLTKGPGYTEALLEQVDQGRWEIIRWSEESCGAAAIRKLGPSRNHKQDDGPRGRPKK